MAHPDPSRSNGATPRPHLARRMSELVSKEMGAFQLGDYSIKRSPSSQLMYQNAIEDRMLQDFQRRYTQRARPADNACFDLDFAAQFMGEGISAIADDSFLRCFQSKSSKPWNWNLYLFPTWCMGVLVRFGVLFPLRLLALLVGSCISISGFLLVQLLPPRSSQRKEIEKFLIKLWCGAFVVSWSGVIRYHGRRPEPPPGRPHGVFVANHTSMIDAIVLEQASAFSLVGQSHPGWVGVMQRKVLGSLDCIWFDRGEARDKQVVARKLQEHTRDPSCNPLLVFPEGTCVNNEYVIQFKKGVFELDTVVCPVAIKYNKIFVDAFWNSRAQSFAQHLLTLMTAWAVVCDVWFLEPQQRRLDESAVDFAARVRSMIADKAGLKVVDWDGYMKHYRPSPRFMESRQKAFAQILLQRLSARALPPRPPAMGTAGSQAMADPGAGDAEVAQHAAAGMRRRSPFASTSSVSPVPEALHELEGGVSPSAAGGAESHSVQEKWFAGSEEEEEEEEEDESAVGLTADGELPAALRHRGAAGGE